MSEPTLYNALIIAWLVVAAATFIAQFFLVAPYGRHVRAGWGPAVSSRTGWLVMEAPAPIVFAVFFLLGDHRGSMPALIFLGLWMLHYVYRAFIYPFRLRGANKPMLLTIIGMGFFFNVVNGYLNGRYLFSLSGGYPDTWLRAPQFLVGVALFVAGLVANRQADGTLRALRRPGETGYKIPRGGLYRWISCPNYLGEMVQWVGWAVATWSLPGLTFAVWTIANLAPRAWANHAWYRRCFPDYPAERRALIPGVW